jgi:DNA repair protein RecO
MSISTPGLLLQAIPYLGKKLILKVFTPEQGLISFFAQESKLAPFCLAEWIYRKTEKEIHSIQDSSLIDPLLELRESYPSLSAAGSIAKDLLRTQMPDKKAPELFLLAHLYFTNLHTSPELFAASFRLKLLFYEGLFSEDLDTSFTSTEWQQVHTLAFTRKLSDIKNLQNAPYNKIKLIFEERFGL